MGNAVETYVLDFCRVVSQDSIDIGAFLWLYKYLLLSLQPVPYVVLLPVLHDEVQKAIRRNKHDHSSRRDVGEVDQGLAKLSDLGGDSLLGCAT